MDLIRVAAHKDADVAILKLASPRSDLPLCQLAPSDHPTKSGDKTIVVGYPRGWKGLFPKLDQKAFDALVKEAPSNDGEMVEALAKVNGIRPHMTEGVLSTITSEQLIYDASTSQGDRHPTPILPIILATAIALACLVPHWRRTRKSATTN